MHEGPPPARRESPGHPLLEGVGALVLGGALAVAMSWPMVRTISRTVPHDIGDPLYFAWQLAWVGHALRTDPRGMWTTPAFDGAPDNLAFTDTVLGYAPLSLLGDGQQGALLALNLAGLIATTMSFVGAYALARALGARVPGALVAGAGFAFAPWRLEQVVHVNVMSTGGMALALAFLAHGHAWSLRHGWRPERGRARWVLAGWLVACYQLTFGFAIGIPFAYSLAVVVGLWWLAWLVRPGRRVPARLVVADLFGGAAFAATAAYLVRPYLRVLEAYPEARRGEEWLWLSPPWRGLITSPASNVWWGQVHTGWREELTWKPEMALLPGFVLIGLALLGLVVSAWPLRRRLALSAVIAVLAVLAVGINAPGQGEWTFLPLYRNLPGWDSLRTPGRFMIWITLGLGLLAAGFVSRITDALWRPWGRAARASELESSSPGTRIVTWGDGEPAGYVAEPDPPGYWPGGAVPGGGTEQAEGPRGLLVRRLGDGARPPRPRGPAALLLALLLVVPAVAVTAEGRGGFRNWEIWPSPVALAELPQPLLVLPSLPVTDYYWMVWQTEGWPRMANGSSGFEPRAQQELRVRVSTFPDEASIAMLRERGIRTVVLVPDWAEDTAWETAADRPVDGLGVSRTEAGGVIVYRIR